MPANASVETLLHRIKRVDVFGENPDLHHVAGLAVAAVAGGNADDVLSIEWADAFMQHKAFWACHGRTELGGSSSLAMN